MTQIIANHSIVEDYRKIPQRYLAEVKKMWLDVPGESHSRGYIYGMDYLAALDARFAVEATLEATSPPAYRTDALRVTRTRRTQYGSWTYSTGEENWYTNATAISRLKQYLLDYCHATGPALAALGFGWCWDMTWHNTPTATKDAAYKCGWAGASDTGPEGDLAWGLDAADSSITGNSVCMDTYLATTEEYRTYCVSSGYPTKVFFTTGPIDGYSGESGYQRHVKHEYLRNYVVANEARILFDYADILAWSNAGEHSSLSWTDGEATPHAYPMIHADNLLNFDGRDISEDGGCDEAIADHIGERGALRLAKAMWWMLARMAGWDGLREDHGAKMVTGIRV